ncbi:hypothetical protein KAU33_15885 [Candidatus Dependentiae bacterium]|nr:hypothetical protein [Candidatus Dependentiae bacterium]
MKSVRKGLTKLDDNLYINKNNGDIFLIHGNWLKTPVGSIAGTELFEVFNDSFGTKEGDETRKAIARSLIKIFNQE